MGDYTVNTDKEKVQTGIDKEKGIVYNKGIFKEKDLKCK